MEAFGRQGQINPPGPLEGAKGVRLRGPVEIAQRTSIAVQVVLGLLMIRQGDPDRVQRRPGVLASARHRLDCGRKWFRIRQGCVLASSITEIRRHLVLPPTPSYASKDGNASGSGTHVTQQPWVARIAKKPREFRPFRVDTHERGGEGGRLFATDLVRRMRDCVISPSCI